MSKVGKRMARGGGGAIALVLAGVMGVMPQCVGVARGDAAVGPAAVPGAGASGGGGIDFVEITPATRAAVDRGLARLAALEGPDGNFSPAGQWNVAVTSIACLAFMADGNLPGRGRYGENVERGLGYILRNSQETGLISADQGQGAMYGHGFATLFLGEVYGMTGDPNVREKLIKAVRLIVTTQNTEGGWRYNPVPVDADISVTICQIMGLRWARNAGLSVPKTTIDRAILYVRGCQNLDSDGGFNYQTGSGGSGFPRSAAGVASLYYAGVYEDNALAKGLDYLVKSAAAGGASGSGYYYYGNYYAVQAMFLAGGKYWSNWFPKIREEILKFQQPDGGWNNDGYGEGFCTGMALIILQIPNRFLPVLQR